MQIIANLISAFKDAIKHSSLLHYSRKLLYFVGNFCFLDLCVFLLVFMSSLDLLSLE